MKKNYYLGGIGFYQLEFEDIDLEAIFRSQLINLDDFEKEVFEEIVELEYEGSQLVKAVDHIQGIKYPATIEKEIQHCHFEDLEINRCFYLVRGVDPRKGFNLFGEPSKDFCIPKDDEDYTVNFYGKLTKKTISWLPFEDIELFAPEFLTGTLYIDYSNRKAPKYLNQEVIQKKNYPEQGKGFTIRTFEEEPIANSRSLVESQVIGHTGVPYWIQNPEIPRCPKSGKVMRFMLELDSYSSSIQTNQYNYEPRVYIFMEPSTNILGILLQI